GMIGWVIKNHTPVSGVGDSGPSYCEAIEGKLKLLGIKSYLIVPLKNGADVLGAMAFGSNHEGAYHDEDLNVSMIYSMFLTTALSNVATFEDAQKRVTQIELINQVAAQLTKKLVLEELLSAAANAIQKSFNYFDVTIFLVSEDKTELVLEAHSGNFIDFLPHGYRLPFGSGVSGWVAARGERALVNDVTKDPRYLVYSYHNTRSELAVPIKVENMVLGVLNVEDTKLSAFDETDCVVLETLCDQLGSAIKNARLYDEVRKANMKLTELDKMKSEFLGIVSHDFRSPLSSIILASKSMLRKESVQADKQVYEYLKLISEQAARLNQLAEDTLSITKIESGQLNYYFKIVNVERLIQDAMSMVRYSNRHALEYKVDQEAIFIKGDQPKLRQVVQNLINNAVKYSPRGGKVNILVDDHPPEEILVAISDEGIGIPPEQIEKLFQKFSRVDSGEARDIKGSGLGLWICKEIVQAHGGRIWIESESGKGSTFKFTLKKAH
ncbi:MAG TPA: ATP-binding protein, partial [Bacteroidota bacterium]|nr:ATP-binding protein [Bacteroidota bacterium]